jgi:PAS domain S-box-containing protein
MEVLENLSDGFLGIDTGLHVTLVNRAAERIVGRARADLLGRRITDCFPHLVATRLLAALETVLTTRQPVELLRTTVDDQLIEVCIVPVQGGASVFLRNVSAQRALLRRIRSLEARLWQVYESSGIGIAFGRGNRFTEANDAMLAMMGCSREDFEARRPDWREVTAPEYHGRCDRAWNAINARQRVEPFESEYVRNDGSRLPVVVAGAVLLDRNEWACIVLDNSDRDRAAKFRERLVAIVSHDLRTPLTSIMLTAAAAARTGDAPLTHLMSRVLRAGTRMSRIVDDVLDYSQAALGSGVPIHREPCCMHTLVEAIIAELQPVYPGRRFELSGPEDVMGEWDPARLTRVLENLLTNAARYSPPDSPISVAWHRDSVGEVALSVHNEGPPIPPEVLPHLFEPFRTARHRQSRQSRGLGLYIAREIVRAHGGQISIDSRAPSGTTVTIRLPQVAPAREEAAASASRL